MVTLCNPIEIQILWFPFMIYKLIFYRLYSYSGKPERLFQTSFGNLAYYRMVFLCNQIQILDHYQYSRAYNGKKMFPLKISLNKKQKRQSKNDLSMEPQFRKIVRSFPDNLYIFRVYGISLWRTHQCLHILKTRIKACRIRFYTYDYSWLHNPQSIESLISFWKGFNISYMAI